MADDNRYDRNFVVQQGLEPPAAATCRPLSAALRFQPRLIAPLILIATLTQSAGLFLLLACVQWWSALVPTLNPFDALYRVTVGRSSTAVPLPVARAPRRFSMGMAGTFALFTSLAIYRQWWPAAYTLEAFFVVAVTAVAWGRLCFGSFLYYLFRGQVKFAVQTLPWGQGV